MANLKKPYTATTNDDGSISISNGIEGEDYNFCEPLGKHLVALEKYKNANLDSTELEDMAYLMSLLEVESMPMEHFLNLPLKLFKFIAQELNQFFRLDDA